MGEQDPMSRVCKYLVDNGVIVHLRTRHDKYPRFITLCSSDIFARLVTVYTSQFRLLSTESPSFKEFVEAFPPAANTTAWDHAARIYISGWFHDLYVSNRRALMDSSTLADYTKHYAHGEGYCSLEYDEFLTRLNAAIRPTHIQGTPEDSLFIPLMADTIDWNHPTSNWFGITNFMFDYDCVRGLIQMMKGSKFWSFSRLVTNTTGRPSWLFDWHSDKHCCAWFPAEGNYSMDDVTMAYKVGVACTPHLGPRDLDDWQPFPNGNINRSRSGYERVTERRFFGNYEVRTLEVKTFNYFNAPPSRSKHKRKEKSSDSNQEVTATDIESTEVEVVQEMPYFRLSDWTYYALLREPKC